MSIKLELEEREWEVIVRLVHEERDPQGRNKRFLSGEGWNVLLNKLIDAGIEEALALPEDKEMQTMRKMFNFLVQEKDDG